MNLLHAWTVNSVNRLVKNPKNLEFVMQMSKFIIYFSILDYLVVI